MAVPFEVRQRRTKNGGDAGSRTLVHNRLRQTSTIIVGLVSEENKSSTQSSLHFHFGDTSHLSK